VINIAMIRKIFLFSGLSMLIFSCATPKIQESSGRLSGKEVKVLRKAEVKQAVDIRRFLVRFDKLYTMRGGRVDLIPKANYIIIDGDRVILSAAYVGRQYGIRPIAAINMTGKAEAYEIKNNPDKGSCHIKVKVSSSSNTFDVYIDISPEGYCEAAVTNLQLDQVRYRGSLLPLRPRPGQGGDQEEQKKEDAAIETV
jgi:hypothetical protein